MAIPSDPGRKWLHFKNIPWTRVGVGDFLWLEIVYGGSIPLSDIALNDTERSYTVCVVGVLYAFKRICGRAGFSALRAVFLLWLRHGRFESALMQESHSQKSCTLVGKSTWVPLHVQASVSAKSCYCEAKYCSNMYALQFLYDSYEILRLSIISSTTGTV